MKIRSENEFSILIPGVDNRLTGALANSRFMKYQTKKTDLIYMPCRLGLSFSFNRNKL